MTPRVLAGHGLGALLALSILLSAAPSAWAQRILFHGADTAATAGDDEAVLTHLESLFGANNVMYMQGDMAAADGSSATGFDAIVISSTLNSGTVRGKYDDAPLGVLQWEQALTRDDDVGNFDFSDGGGDRAAGTRTQIEILDSAHPIAGGLSGTVSVFNSPQPTMVGTGDVGPGVTLVANMIDPANPDDHAIMAADVGDELFGGEIAPGRRVHFFLQDVGFVDLTPAGIQLFNNAVNFVANVLEPITPGDFDGDMDVDIDDFTILSMNLGGHLDGPVGREQGDMNFDGKVDLADFGEFKAIFPGAAAQAHAIPEPSTMALVLFALAAAPLSLIMRRTWSRNVR